MCSDVQCIAFAYGVIYTCRSFVVVCVEEAQAGSNCHYSLLIAFHCTTFDDGKKDCCQEQRCSKCSTVKVAKGKDKVQVDVELTKGTSKAKGGD